MAMKILLTRTMLVVLTVLGVGNTQAQQVKPGLWETRLTKNVVDGVDKKAEMEAAIKQTQAAMAKMSPAQKKQMEEVMKSSGVSMQADGAVRLCISPEMAKMDKTWVPEQSGCKPTKYVRNGNQIQYEISCKINGTTTEGKGVSSISGDSVSSVVDMVTTDAKNKKNKMHMESSMKLISADCGSLKPIQPPTKKP